MRRMRAAKAAIPTILILSALVCSSAAWGANTYDWASARQSAERASSPRDKEAAWGDLAYTHLRLAGYYKQLTGVSAQAQISIAQRRASYDGSAATAAAHAFIAAGQFDSAAVWAGTNPTLRTLQQFAQAQSRGEAFGYSGASEPVIGIALAGLHVTGDPSKLRDLAGKLGKSTPVASLLSAIISADVASIPASLIKVEQLLANPPGIDKPLLDQYSDPLIYSALARAHALLAVDVSSIAASDASAAAVPFFRFLSGLARYTVGDYDKARDDLNASTGTDVAGIAYAYLAGIEWRQGNRAGAMDLATKSLAEEKQIRRGESLVALARVQSELPGTNWGADGAAREIIQRKPDSRGQMYTAYWATGLINGDAQPDSAKQMFWLAADKRKPDIRHGFHDIYGSPPELFCTNYISALTSGGSHGNGLDYLDAFNGLMELAKFIPATEPLKEGLRWLSLVTNEDSDIRP